MSLILKRVFAFITLCCYLVVGTVVVRFSFSETVRITFNQTYLEFLKDAPIKVAQAGEAVKCPEMKFAAIVIPKENSSKKIFEKKNRFSKKPSVLAVISIRSNYELPFHEIVKIEKIKHIKELATNMVALYKDFSYEEKMVAKTKIVEDTINTKLAARETKKIIQKDDLFAQKESQKMETISVSKNEIGQEALLANVQVKTQTQYSGKKTAVKDSQILPLPEMTTQNDQATTEQVEERESIETEEVSELIGKSEPEVKTAEEDGFFEYKKEVVKENKNFASKNQQEQVDIVAFDYSHAKQDITTTKIPTVTSTSSHLKNQPVKLSPVVNPLKTSLKMSKKNIKMENYPMDLNVRALGTDLQKLHNLEGFEVRFQDDLSETLEDFGSGEVKFESVLSEPKMTRSVVVLKRGYVPTSTELILEEGSGSVSIPLIEEEILNDLARPYEGNGSIGSLLVELDDETEIAKLDVPFSEVVKLNGDLKKTDGEDFRYQLFLGVKSGNSMISYHRQNGEVVTKILHVHENELTYDANFYEDVVNEKIRLFEEDLLGRENTPLIISSENVRVFAKNSFSKKINNHTYKMNFSSSHLGGRRYLELTHQSEPVFIGLRENTNVIVPSENFMRFILSKVEGQKLGNRCLVQVNLKKKTQKYDVSSESVGASLMTYTQVLDADGKFYESLSDKSRKLIIIGESQASSDISPEAKINIKIQYLDGTSQFINTYCSPNTYLVEQL